MTLPPPYPDTPVDTVLRNRVAKLGKAHAAPERDSPFIVADLSKTLRQHQRWMHFLPQIQPFYGEDIRRRSPAKYADPEIEPSNATRMPTS